MSNAPSICVSIRASHRRIAYATDVRTDVRTNGRICISPSRWKVPPTSRTHAYETRVDFSSTLLGQHRPTVVIHRPNQVGRHTMTPQEPSTWRQLRRGTPPTSEYIAAKEQLTERTGP